MRNPAIEESYAYEDYEGEYDDFLGIFGKKHKNKRKKWGKKITGAAKNIRFSKPRNRSKDVSKPDKEEKDNTMTYLVGGAIALLILFFVVK
ncbi:MAG: hypothetical protein AAFQ94_09200 [Bacteroidota bacterium]